MLIERRFQYTHQPERASIRFRMSMGDDPEREPDASAYRLISRVITHRDVVTIPFGRVRKQEKRPGREPGDFVGSNPTSVSFGPVLKRKDTSPTCWRRWFNSIRDHCWFFGLWRYLSYKKISRLSLEGTCHCEGLASRGQELFS